MGAARELGMVARLWKGRGYDLVAPTLGIAKEPAMVARDW